MGSRARMHLTLVSVIIVVSATLLVFANNNGHHDIATDAFQSVWERTDYPVQQGETERTWLWGPGANTPLMQEEYAEAPDGLRDVQYFDKSRMEMPWNDADPDSPWYITQGLLARELMTGELQLGDNTFEYHAPSQRPAAGDPDGVTAPTYATMGQFIDSSPRAQGTHITEAIDNTGTVSEDAELAQYGVIDEYYVDITNQYVASVFWEFMNSSGTVYEHGAFVHGDIFENPFYAIGLPLTPAYWAEVKVADVKQDVLIQCFERRCLTFTPENEIEWQVESGNIGQHYYHWRYSEIDRDAIGASFTALPQARTYVPGDDRVILVTVYDSAGDPIDGVPVHAEVTWSSGYYQNHTGIEMTGKSGDDGDGQVFLSYTGQEIATDNITVTVAGVATPKVVSTTWVRTRAEIPDDQDDDDFDPPEPVEPGDPYTIDLAHDNGDTKTAGDSHTVVATVTDEDGNPVEDGTEIDFTITGSNSDESGTATTEGGIATFTYTGTTAGTDTITAHWNDTSSNEIEVTIEPGDPASLILSHLNLESNPPVPESVIYLESHTILGLVADEFSNPVPDVLVDFSIEGANAGTIGVTELTTDVDNRAQSGEDGIVSFAYTGTSAGEDTVFGNVVNDTDDDIVEFLNKTWLDLRVTTSTPDGSSAHIGTEHSFEALVEFKEHEADVWNPLPDTLVGLEISGDNAADANLSESPFQTDADGLVTLAYTGSSIGQDTLIATVMSSAESATSISDDASVDWYAWSVELAHGPGESPTNPINTSHAVVAELSVDGNGPIEGVELTFAVTGNANPGVEGETGGETGNSGSTGGSGTLEFRYAGGEHAGTDEIEVSVTDARANGQVNPDSVTKTWVDYGIHFDHQAENIYFTDDEVAYITGLALEHYDFGISGDPTPENMAQYWGLFINENSPNNHTVNVSVTENGEKIESGEIAILVEREDSEQNPLYENETLAIQDEVATFVYAINEDIGPGADDIQATYGQFSNNTTKTWIPLENAEYDQLPIYVFITVEPENPTVDDPVTITVQVLDQFGQPISGHPVDVSSSTQGELSGDGSNCPEGPEFENKHCTGEDGEIEIPHESNDPGEEEIQVTPEGGETFSQTINWEYGAPFSLELEVDPSEQTVGETVTLSAVVKDEPGNAIPDVSVQFDTDRSSDEIDTVSTGPDGEAAEITGYTQTQSGSEQITASVNGVSDSDTITWVAGDMATFLLAHTRSELEVENPEPVETDTNVVDESHTVYALVVDAWGNPIPGEVTFEVSGENTTSGDRPISQGTGIASFTYDNTDNMVGTDTITATIDEGETSASNQLTKYWVAGEAHSIIFEHDDTDDQTSTNTVGESHTVSVTVEDEFGNLLTDASGTITFTVEDDDENVIIPDEQDQSLPDNEVQLADGSASFTYIWTKAETHTITFQHDLDVDSENIHHESLTKIWVADEAYQIALAHEETSSNTAQNVVGDEHVVIATVQDEYGNTVEHFTGSVTLTIDNHGNLNKDAEDGIATFSYTGPNVPRTDTIGAELTEVDSVTHITTLTKHWVAGDAANIQLSHSNDFEDPDIGDKTNIIGEDPSHTVYAWVADTFDNDVADGTDVQFTVTRNGNALSLDDDGIVGTEDGIASITWGAPETEATDVITVEVVGDSSVTSTPASLTKNWEFPPDYAVTLSHEDPENPVGTQHTFTATLTDDGTNVDFADASVASGDVTVTIHRDGAATALDPIPDLDVQISGAIATIEYTGPTSPAVDVISVVVEINGENVAAENTLTKTWVAGSAAKVSLEHGGDHAGHEGEDPPANARYLEPHTVVATVMDKYDNIVDGDLEFTLSREQGSQTAIDMWVHDPSEDPEEGASGNTGTTSGGVLAFTYTGAVAGIDQIAVDLMVDDESEDDASVYKQWQDVRITLTPENSANNPVNTSHELTALVEVEVEGVWQPRDGVDVDFAVTSANTGHDDNYPGVYSRVTGEGTNDPGETTFSYTGTNHGTDTITATITDTTISATATKEWIDIQFSFDPENATNPFFTEAEINHLLELALGDNPTSQDIEEFWDNLLEHDSPNLHVVDVDVTRNGSAIDDEEEVTVSVVFDASGAADPTIIDNVAYQIEDGAITVTYSAHQTGVDTITASYQGVSDNTTKTWQSLDDYDYDKSPTYVVLDISDSSPSVDDQITLTAKLYDKFGKPTDGTVTFTSDERTGLPAGVSTVNGEAEIQLDAEDIDHKAIDEEITVTSGAVSTSEIIEWGPGENLILTLAVNSTTSPSTDSTVNLVATLEDEYENPIPDETVTFTSDVGALNQGVETSANGTASIVGYSYDDQTSLTEQITAGVDASVIAAPNNADSETINWWIPGVPTAISFTDCQDESGISQSGSNGYCFISAMVTDGGGNQLDDFDVRFEIDDSSWLGSSGQPTYTLRNYDDGSTVGSGSQEQSKIASSGVDGYEGEARVTHVGRSPEVNYQVLFNVDVLDPDDNSIVLVSDTYTFTWPDLDAVSASFSVTVSEDSQNWTEAGSLNSNPDVVGRYALLEVEVLDDSNDPLADQSVTFENVTSNGDLGSFSTDPSSPHSTYGAGENPLEVLTNSQGIAQAVFYLSDPDDLPTTTTIEVNVPAASSPTQEGDIRFIEFPEPNAPTSLTADAAGHDQIDLSWNDSTAPAEVDEYEIQRSLDGSAGWTQVGTTGSQTFGDTDLDPETTYYYRVRGINATGESAWSNVANATTGVEPPAIPQNLSADAQDHQSIALEWEAPSGGGPVEDYEIQYTTESDPNENDWNDLPITSNTEYTHSGLDAETMYYYRVRAVNSTGTSAWSNVASAMTQSAPVSGPQLLAEYSGNMGKNDDKEHSIQVPSTIQNGDYEGKFILLHVTFSDGGDVDIDSAPAGWDFVRRTDKDSDIGHALYWKEGDSSEPSVLDFEFDDDVYLIWGFLIYDGVDLDDPVISHTGANGDSDILRTSTISPLNTDATLVALFGISDDYTLSLSNETPPNPPTDERMTPRHDEVIESELYMLAADERWTETGNTGRRSADASDDAEWVASLIALRPAN
jgi:hypothetical protein